MLGNPICPQFTSTKTFARKTTFTRNSSLNMNSMMMNKVLFNATSRIPPSEKIQRPITVNHVYHYGYVDVDVHRGDETFSYTFSINKLLKTKMREEMTELSEAEKDAVISQIDRTINEYFYPV